MGDGLPKVVALVDNFPVQKAEVGPADDVMWVVVEVDDVLMMGMVVDGVLKMAVVVDDVPTMEGAVPVNEKAVVVEEESKSRFGEVTFLSGP